MENAVDALKIASAVLIFILAIASSFSVIGIAKETADDIINMRDKQAYLKAAELDNGWFYTSTNAVKSGKAVGVTTLGDRIVDYGDIISTIYRYAKEKYGVTIVKEDGTVVARYDSNTEDIIRQYNNIDSGLDTFEEQLENNTVNAYTASAPKFVGKLTQIYEVDSTENKIICGAPWFGNDEEIQKRINADISGGTYSYNKQTYIGKNLFSEFEGKTIVEVTNEIDKSKYIKDNNGQETSLLETYNMPTIEIVYIILDN